jgi:hypothetical protein
VHNDKFAIGAGEAGVELATYSEVRREVGWFDDNDTVELNAA